MHMWFLWSYWWLVFPAMWLVFGVGAHGPAQRL